jgi:hypothetical protein
MPSPGVPGGLANNDARTGGPMKNSLLVAIALLSIVVLMAVVVLPGYACNGLEYPESLNLTITRQPVGGMNVGLISCAYTATYIREKVDDPEKYHQPNGVRLTVSIKNDRGSTYSEQSFDFNENGQSISKVISFQAPAGMYLDKTFWAVFNWRDHSGQKEHTVESSRAVCTVR